VRKASRLIAGVALALAATVVVHAQEVAEQVGSNNAQLSAASATAPRLTTQGVVSSLSNLPDADILFFINPQRILNEVVPKVLPPKDVEGMRKAFEMARQTAGVDPTKVEYIVLAVRVRKPTADLNFQPPEVMAVASGDFSSDALMVLARLASQGKLRDEKYGTKTLGLMTIDPIVKEAEKNPFLKAFTQVGIVTLSPTSIAVGSPNYLRAAVDASEGKDRISADTLNSLVRDPNVLVSIAGRPWNAFSKAFGMMGTEANARTPRCDTRLGDFYAALTMDATNFLVRGAVNEDNPDTAKIFSNLFSGLLRYATSQIKDPAAQSLLTGLAIVPEGDEVILRADFPQQMVINLVQQQMNKPKKAEAAPPAKTTKPAPRRRRTRRGA
jgi:hypothetical protein